MALLRRSGAGGGLVSNTCTAGCCDQRVLDRGWNVGGLVLADPDKNDRWSHLSLKMNSLSFREGSIGHMADLGSDRIGILGRELTCLVPRQSGPAKLFSRYRCGLLTCYGFRHLRHGLGRRSSVPLGLQGRALGSLKVNPSTWPF